MQPSVCLLLPIFVCVVALIRLHILQGKTLYHQCDYDKEIWLFSLTRTHVSYSNPSVHPLVIAAHPQEPNQFALGLSDGVVHVLEPLESDGKWGVPPPAENGSTSTVPATPPAAGSGSEQATQR